MLKIKTIETITDDKLIKLSEILKRDKEIIIKFNNKLFHLQNFEEKNFSINVFKEDDLEIMKNELDFGLIVDAGVFYNKTSLEVVILSLNNFLKIKE